MIRAMVAPVPGDRTRGVLHVAVPVTPYAVECIVDGALGGSGVVLDIPAGASKAAMARVRALVSLLRRWGLEVWISGAEVEGIVARAPDQLPGRASG
jgi:hypothetical protein